MAQDFTMQQLPRTLTPPVDFDIMFGDGVDNYFKGDRQAVIEWLGEENPNPGGEIPGLDAVTQVNGYTPHRVSIGIALDINYNFQAAGNLRLNGNTLNDGTFKTGGKLAVGGDIDALYTARVHGIGLKVDGVLEVGGAVGIGGELFVGDNIIASGNIQGQQGILNSLDVSGSADIGNAMDVGGALGVVGPATFDGAVTVAGALTLAGAANLLGSTFVVAAGNPKFNGDIIDLDADAASTPASGYRGIRVKRPGDGDTSLYWDEVNDDWRAGAVGSGGRLGVLSSIMTDGKFVKWNATTKRLETDDLPAGGGGAVISGTANYFSVFNATGDNIENSIMREIGGIVVDIEGQLSVDLQATFGGLIIANSGQITNGLTVGGLLDVNNNADISGDLDVGGLSSFVAVDIAGDVDATNRFLASSAIFSVLASDFRVHSPDVFFDSTELKLNFGFAGTPTGLLVGLDVEGGTQANRKLAYDFDAGYWKVGTSGALQRLVPIIDSAEDGKFVKFDSNNKRFITADIPASEGAVISGAPNTVAMFNLTGDNVTGSILTQPSSNVIRVNGRLRIDTRTGTPVNILGRDSNGFVCDAGNITDFVSKLNGGDFLNAIGVDEAVSPNFDLKVGGSMRASLSATNNNGNGRVSLANNGSGIRAVAVVLSPTFGESEGGTGVNGGGTFIGGVNGLATCLPGQNSNGGLITGAKFWKFGAASNTPDLPVSRLFEVQVNGVIYQLYGRVKP